MSGQPRPSRAGLADIVNAREPGRAGQEIAVHTATCAAPPPALYELVADVSRWPTILAPVIHVRRSDRSDQAERFQLWALAGDQVHSWVSRRILDPGRGWISFEQEHAGPPIARVVGRWEFGAVGGGTRVVLRHWFAVDSDGPERDRIAAGIDSSSTRALAALCRLATLGHPVEDLVFSFSDQLRLPVSAADAYSFVHRSDMWAQLLPHVSRVALTEPQPGVQLMEMDTVTADGQTHTTESVRLCFPPEGIVYKQLVPPRLLLGHSGAWDFGEDDAGTVAVGRHAVAINPAAAAEVLGHGCTLADAREYLRDVLGANSRATLSRIGVLVPADLKGGP